MSEVTTAIVLETRTKRKNGLYPVKLRLTYERKQKYYSVVIDNKRISMSQKEFNNLMTSMKRSDLRKKMEAIMDSTEVVIQDLKPFSFEGFDKRWNKDKDDKNDLFVGFQDYLARLTKENRIGTAMNYESAMKHIKKYVGNSAIKYNLITTQWLNDYVHYMYKEGKSPTTAAIYVRALRVILRSEGMSYVKKYPFDGFNMPISKGRKNEALNLDQIKELAQYKTDQPTKQMALDFWLFSYNCGGANYEDIFRLKWKNVSLKNEEISYFRRKTRLTRKRDKKPIIVPITKSMKKVISKYSTGEKPDDYVFPLLASDMSETKKRRRVKDVTRNFNKYTIEIGKELKFEINLSATVARHSRASIMNFQGQHYSVIGDMLGHSSLATTEHYLKSFSREAQKKAMKDSEV